MDPQTHPDPFREALHHGLQRAAQIASAAVTGAQVLIHLRRSQARIIAERHARARRALEAQARADRQADRASWAPALDPDWVRHADLVGTARIWGAAMPYSDPAMPWHEPAATTAMRHCEQRLRELHPFAMTHYDQLRAKGTPPADAMSQAAPLFGYPPQPSDPAQVTRLALPATTGTPDPAAAPPEPSPAAPSASPSSAPPVGAAQKAPAAPSVAASQPELAVPDVPTTSRSSTARPDRAARPWIDDFPLPIRDVVAIAGRAAQSPTPLPTAAPAPGARPAARAPRPS